MKNRIWFKLLLSSFLILLTFSVAGTVEAAAPTLSPVVITSSNASTTVAKVGDVITISFTPDQLLGEATSTINGFAAVVASSSPTLYTATYTMTSGSSDGPITFNIGFRAVTANLYGVDVTAVTSGPSVIFDKTVPTITPITIASNNASTTVAKVGDIRLVPQ